jgi:hypothetical protein
MHLESPTLAIQALPERKIPNRYQMNQKDDRRDAKRENLPE